jgi:hypothetical protein
MGFPVNFPFNQSIDSYVKSHVPRLGASSSLTLGALGALGAVSRKNGPRKAREPVDWCGVNVTHERSEIEHSGGA